tara:strand:- start:573 stop:914 length:342 start_codon:yes stop_codon:yes gene_type:complete
MLDGSLSNLNNFNKVSPYSKVDTANAMPINNLRVVDPVNQNLRSKEYVQNHNIREIYSGNLAPSSSFSTEKFLKSKSILTPVFIQNEAKTKYEMVSRIPLKKEDLNSEVNVLA